MNLIQKDRVINGRRILLRLEPCVWLLLGEIAAIENCKTDDVIGLIEDIEDREQSLASSIHIFLMLYFRGATNERTHRAAGHGNLLRMHKRVACIKIKVQNKNVASHHRAAVVV